MMNNDASPDHRFGFSTAKPPPMLAMMVQASAVRHTNRLPSRTCSASSRGSPGRPRGKMADRNGGGPGRTCLACENVSHGVPQNTK
eukprot:258474-Heterocapsa_arctica.AAC.1